jgi:predicted nucleotidyltransferase
MHERICRKKYLNNYGVADMVDEKNKSLILDSINKYLTELQKNDINIVGAYLFGSYSKNNADKWSDKVE